MKTRKSTTRSVTMMTTMTRYHRMMANKKYRIRKTRKKLKIKRISNPFKKC